MTRNENKIPDASRIETINQPPYRTFLLKILVVAYLALAWFGGIRCYAVFANREILAGYLSQNEMIYLAIGGAVWALAGLNSAVILWIGFPSSTWFSRWIALGCFIWYWLDSLFLTQSSLSRTNWPFTLIATLLALAFAWGIPALPKESRFLQRKSGRSRH